MKAVLIGDLAADELRRGASAFITPVSIPLSSEDKALMDQVIRAYYACAQRAAQTLTKVRRGETVDQWAYRIADLIDRAGEPKESA